MENPVLPRYAQVKQHVLALIAKGEYEADKPFITQREVCERFGVSTTTAIRALNDLVADGVLVRRQGRGTFVAVVEEPPSASPALSRRPGAIACVIHGQGPVKSGIIAGVESVCAELGFEMLLYDSKDSVEVQERALRRAIDSGVSGVVLYAVEGSSPAGALAELIRRGTPIVMVDRYLPDLVTDVVTVDQFAVGYELTEYLISLGHERMAMLWDETDCSSVRDRLSGHLQALRVHNLPARPDLSVLTAHQKLSPADRTARLAALLAHPEPPTVLICCDGFIVTTAASELADLGIAVPDQVELAGMDDAGPHNILPLTVAAAALPVEEMGRQATHLLAERFATGAPSDARRIVLPITIHTRTHNYLQVVAAR